MRKVILSGLLGCVCCGAFGSACPAWDALFDGKAKIRVQQGQPPARIVSPGVFELPADGRRDCCWDFPMNLDLSDAAFVEFDCTIGDVAVFSSFPLYFQSGSGWYHASLPVESAIMEQHVRVKVGGSSCEGKPLGWDRTNGFRIRAYRSIERPTTIRIGNFRVIPKAEVADTPENRARKAAEKARKLAQAKEWAAKELRQKPGERRLVWAHSANGIKTGHRQFIGWDETVRRLRACGYTDLIANLCWGGSASYTSKVLPKSSPDEFKFLYREDQFELCKAACRKYGMKFHPWRVCFMTSWRNTKEETEGFRRAGLLTVNHDLSEETGAWAATFCPSSPENQKREIDAMCELADKGCDGIHFDYIRYQGPNACFCPRCRERFAKATGREFGNWPADLDRDEAALADWRRWRCENITRIVRAVHDYVKKNHPETEISVAARSGVSGARDGDGQDWAAWAKEGLVDFLCPMDYTSVTPFFRNVYLAQLKAIEGSRAKLYPGIGLACWGEDDGDHIRRFGREILQLREDGLAGFTLFAVTKDTLPLMEMMKP